MTQKVYSVITNSGDGSNSLMWFTSEEVLNKVEELADEGDSSFASGDGLQLREFYFPDDFDLDAWFKLNHIYLTTFEDVDREAY